ncbi:porin family protein [Natronoflexus pectinivorans]|uniref:Outer membrane protein with beta-barrel domain n=1 Tax=Natronoflexus pectinivorans TaxID=682526 RepID=A0A4R2GH20_9BACT|nr:porin family protein [Natronoflexus pectinivorans]TCO07676.1 outer membrane protein with beta-barrel domain [Natronoflexus pectinivorans]
MKKLFSLFIILISITQLSAQHSGDFRFSFVLTPQISWMKSDHQNVDDKGSRAGYNFGVLMDRFFGHNYAFATGLTINTTGGKLSYDTGEEVFSQRYNLKYLEVPLGLRLRSEDIRRTNIYGRFGLSPQINIQAQDGNGNSISSEVRFFDLGYHLGGGIEYSVGGRNALMIGLLFNNGFTDITNKSGFNDKSILNRFVFEFGFIF